MKWYAPTSSPAASIGKALCKGRIHKIDTLRRLKDHGGDTLRLDHRKIDADFITMIKVDDDIGYDRRDVGGGVEHWRVRTFFRGKVRCVYQNNMVLSMPQHGRRSSHRTAINVYSARDGE